MLDRSASFYQQHLFFCINQKSEGKKCCSNGHALDFFEYTKQKLKELDLLGPQKIRVSSSGCLGRCALGPILVIYPDAIWYTYHSIADIDLIITQHIQAGKIVSHLLIDEPGRSNNGL